MGLWLLISLPSTALAQPTTKSDSLRWAMMMWEKEGNAELGALIDSLRLCMTQDQDDGSGVTVEVGDSEGLSVTPSYEIETFTPGRGFTYIWKGRDQDAPEPFDIVIAEVLESTDPETNTGAGVSVGVDFPSLTYETLRIVITNDGEVVTDTLVTDPGPTPPGPGPFPFPSPATFVWIDFDLAGSDFPPFTWCEKTEAEKREESDLFSGAQRTPAMPEVLVYSYELIEPMAMKVKGSSRPIVGDRIVMVPQDQGTAPDYVLGMQVVPRRQMETTLIGTTVKKFGLEHLPNLQGKADLVLQNDLMHVRNIGASGLNGVRTLLNEGTETLRAELVPLALRNGEALTWRLGGNVNGLFNDSLVVLSTKQVNGRTFFQIDAAPETGWTEFTLQFVRNGSVMREAKIPNGFRFGTTGLTLKALGVASLNSQSWAGFLVGVLRNGQGADIRLVPKDGIPMSSVTLTDFSIDASSPFEDLTLGYEEIKWTVIATNAPARRTPTARLGAPQPTSSEAPNAPRLLGHYPEPFNPVTTIQYTLSEASTVRLEVFDLTGRRVALLADGHQTPGAYAVRFDASRLASEVYLYRLQAGTLVQARTMRLLK